ncbi:hypothetical protein AKJ64_05025 [candidate division MSBL1 archaeon SCGC-AAA259E17]|uniref:Prepilin type IV endopeptidase peptidase domain-containing protein n=1 Tax=candidate division MSBL1 archaeon SCGC-AAA259E17 TaxID=1698263 RepID=A0A133U9W4_9EURY|nr:hypothetical protein AKJ64_05025 [candidate division MSBL1 archaeon SCGC-AAA259E17]
MTVLGQWVATLQSPPFPQISLLAAGIIIIAAVVRDYRTLTIPDWFVSVSTLGTLLIWATAGYAVKGIRMVAYIITLAGITALAVYMVGALSRSWMKFGFGDVKLMVPLSLFFPALSFQVCDLPHTFEPCLIGLVSPLTFALNTVLSFVVFLLAFRIYCRLKGVKKLVPLTPVMAGSFLGTALFGAFWRAALSLLIFLLAFLISHIAPVLSSLV